MVFLSALLAASLLQPTQKIDVTALNYQGWSGAYRIANQRFSIVVVPQIGRIVYAGYDKDQKNLLWTNSALAGVAPNMGKGDYQNFGGDKVWIAPQSLWNWPPDPDIDGSPWTATATDNGVIMTSPVSAKYHVQMEREISLGGGGNVRIRNTMINKGTEPVELGVWEVVQVDNPNIVALTAKPTAGMANGYVGLQDSTVDNTYQKYDAMKQILFIQRDPAKGRKFGAGSPDGTIEATIGSGNLTYTFAVEAPYEPSATYPDSGSAMEVYTNPDPNAYAELELLSPVRKIRPNQRISLAVHWQIKKVKL